MHYRYNHYGFSRKYVRKYKKMCTTINVWMTDCLKMCTPMFKQYHFIYIQHFTLLLWCFRSGVNTWFSMYSFKLLLKCWEFANMVYECDVPGALMQGKVVYSDVMICGNPHWLTSRLLQVRGLHTPKKQVLTSSQQLLWQEILHYIHRRNNWFLTIIMHWVPTLHCYRHYLPCCIILKIISMLFIPSKPELRPLCLSVLVALGSVSSTWLWIWSEKLNLKTERKRLQWEHLWPYFQLLFSLEWKTRRRWVRGTDELMAFCCVLQDYSLARIVLCFPEDTRQLLEANVN